MKNQPKITVGIMDRQTEPLHPPVGIGSASVGSLGLVVHLTVLSKICIIEIYILEVGNESIGCRLTLPDERDS
jgi:hypothetical protein